MCAEYSEEGAEWWTGILRHSLVKRGASSEIRMTDAEGNRALAVLLLQLRQFRVAGLCRTLSTPRNAAALFGVYRALERVMSLLHQSDGWTES